MLIRQILPGDAPILAEIFYDAVHKGAASHYTQAERLAWAPTLPDPGLWAAKLDRQTVYVAVDPKPVGFMTREDRYLDLAYVRPERRGTGLAAALLHRLEQDSRSVGLLRLTVHASHPARRFFERQGWMVDGPNTVTRDNVTLHNWSMSRDLTL